MREFTDKAKKALQYAEETAARESHDGSVGTEHILCGLIRENSGLAGRVLADAGITEDAVLSLVNQFVNTDTMTVSGDKGKYTPAALSVLDLSHSEAERFHAEMTGTEHLLISLLKHSDCIASRVLHTLNANIQAMYQNILAAIGEDLPEAKEAIRNASEQAPSSTPTLDQFSRDLTQLAAEDRLDPVIGRSEEIMRVIQILSRRTKNNPCLIGEPGVGKTAVVEGLARMIVEDSVPFAIKGRRLLSLDVSGMVAGTKYRGEFEERIKKIIAEASGAGDVVLFIDELHTIIGAGGAEGALDAANILKPALARGELQIIGATTIDEYRKHIEKDSALERRFQPVTIEEPDEADSIAILKGLRPRYEAHHKVRITDAALEAAVKLSRRYINDRFLPDKAIDLVDEAASRIRIFGYRSPDAVRKAEEKLDLLEQEKDDALMQEDFGRLKELMEKTRKQEKELQKLRKKHAVSDTEELCVTEADIADVVSSWTKIPLSQLNEKEAERIKNLEEILHERIVSQDEAVSAVARAIRRGRLGIKDPRRPIGSFMFLGPTGVGKTELSKALAEVVFGSENALIRVDMSEFMEKHSVSRLIGSPPGYVGFDEGGQLSEKVRRNPYSVVLFDEIEKAHPDVFNILLQVLDDGHITDAQGRKIDFKNTIIIMTSNAGAQNIITPRKLGFASSEDVNRDYNDMKTKVMEELRQLFRPEFLNRLDEIIVFRQLTKENMGKIVDIMFAGIARLFKEEAGVRLKMSEDARQYLIDAGYDEKFGARPLRRTLQTLVEDRLAEEMLDGRVANGDSVVIQLTNTEPKKLRFAVRRKKADKKEETKLAPKK